MREPTQFNRVLQRYRDNDYHDHATRTMFNFSQTKMDDACHLADWAMGPHDPDTAAEVACLPQVVAFLTKLANDRGGCVVPSLQREAIQLITALTKGSV